MMIIKEPGSLTQPLESLIVTCLRALSAQQNFTVPADLGRATPLFGDRGMLDSLTLVALVVAVEQAIEDELGASVSLADEKALSQKHSPYRTIGSLADYAGGLIHEAN